MHKSGQNPLDELVRRQIDDAKARAQAQPLPMGLAGAQARNDSAGDPTAAQLAPAPPALGPSIEPPMTRPHTAGDDLSGVEPRSVGLAPRPVLPPEVDGVYVISVDDIGSRLTQIVAESAGVLRQSNHLVGPMGTLVQPSDNGLSLLAVPPGSIESRLARLAAFAQTRRPTKKDPEGGTIRVLPPRAVTAAIASMNEFPGFPRVDAVKNSPFYVRGTDGKIRLVCDNGYCAEARTWLHMIPSSEQIRIPTTATRAEARRALANLYYLLSDFPLTDVGRAAFVAAMLAVLLRSVIGVVPIILFLGNRQGVGKSRLVDILSLIVLGRIIEKTMYSPDQEEFRKALLSALREGVPLLNLDNITGVFDHPALAALVTGSGAYSDRDLGRAVRVLIQSQTVVVASGNNVLPGEDLQRRIMPLTLESPEENPEDRTDFTEGDILGYVARTRAAFMGDLLTTVQAFLDAGQPDQGLASWGSFEGFGLVRNIVVFAGGADPALARADLKGTDVGRIWLTRFLAALEQRDPAGTGLSSAQILENATAFGVGKKTSLADAIEEIKPASGKISATMLTRKLTTHKNQRAGDLVLRLKVSHNLALWFAERIEKKGSN